ncbi:ATP-dependent DNA helicase RecG [Pseudactinotalea sp. Z1739]|uniref:ATP-dependent DNA helicase RecG n=1 Tax=Pseudactinotalea sp. Z1739 TaxID=3413028 RepID=UPI003C79F879
MPGQVSPGRALERVVGRAAERLASLGIHSLPDLLYHFPRKIIPVSHYSSLAEVTPGEYGTVIVEVQQIHGRPTRRHGLHLTTLVVTDGVETADAVFFGRGKGMEFALRKAVPPGSRVELSGDVDWRGGRIQFKNVTYAPIDPDEALTEDVRNLHADLAELETGQRQPKRRELRPVYPATAEVPLDLVRASIEVALAHLDSAGLHDPIPAEVLRARDLMPLASALETIHNPPTMTEYEAAQHRFRFEEAFLLQTALARRRADIAAYDARARPGRSGGLVEALDAALPFELTQGQREVAAEIAADLADPHPMQRLLQGEVGSGKTVVAVRAMLQVVESGGQAALLAPTEVLAQQHARSIADLLGPLGRAGMLDGDDAGTRIVLLTGSITGARRRQVLAEIASGAAGIVIGTHALLQEQVQFADLGLTVIDEQHRFGVQQREALRAKSNVMPHQLYMTATPIPRSVAMTFFGDVEVSTLREIPAGRAPVTTHIVPAANERWLARAWTKIAEEIDRGNRAYVVAPRISSGTAEESTDLVDDDDAGPAAAASRSARAGRAAGPGGGPSGAPAPMSNVTDVAQMLARHELLAHIPQGMLHGRLPAEEKDVVMASFADGRAPLLVTTTVVEVGVDVPEATVMVILDAERFGLSQLHQLRGRVGRGSEPGLCLLVTAAEPGSPAHERLAILERTNDGFVLAEEDLKTRKEGDVLGSAQSGRSRSLRLLRVVTDRDIIARAREDARALIEQDPNLVHHPELLTAITTMVDPEHEEYLDRA